jgi:hypothetical protein
MCGRRRQRQAANTQRNAGRRGRCRCDACIMGFSTASARRAGPSAHAAGAQLWRRACRTARVDGASAGKFLRHGARVGRRGGLPRAAGARQARPGVLPASGRSPIASCAPARRNPHQSASRRPPQTRRTLFIVAGQVVDEIDVRTGALVSRVTSDVTGELDGGRALLDVRCGVRRGRHLDPPSPSQIPLCAWRFPPPPRGMRTWCWCRR